MNKFMGYSAYLVRETDSFDPEHFPALINDIEEIKEKTKAIIDSHKADILISFSVNHSLKLDWLETNKAFSSLVVEGNLPTKNIVALFDSCKLNTGFKEQLQNYIRSRFNDN